MAKPAKQLGVQDIEARLERLFKSLSHDEESISVIVGTAFVDHFLGALLSKHLIDGRTTESLLDSQGPIGGILNKAKIVYCLGLISKGCLKSIETVAQIRNEFAHKLDISRFDDNEKITELCTQLRAPAGNTLTLQRDDGEIVQINFVQQAAKQCFPENSRGHFAFIVTMICEYLHSKLNVASKCERLEDDWDCEA